MNKFLIILVLNFLPWLTHAGEMAKIDWAVREAVVADEVWNLELLKNDYEDCFVLVRGEARREARIFQFWACVRLHSDGTYKAEIIEESDTF